MEKEFEYAAKLNEQIANIFDEDSDNHISLDDFNDEKNATAFFHALASIVPTRFYNKLTSSNLDTLGFNHIANRLCFQFGKKV